MFDAIFAIARIFLACIVLGLVLCAVLGVIWIYVKIVHVISGLILKAYDAVFGGLYRLIFKR